MNLASVAFYFLVFWFLFSDGSKWLVFDEATRQTPAELVHQYLEKINE